jgi:hypothetical protein
MAIADYVPPMSQLMQENTGLRSQLHKAQCSLRDQFATAALQGILAHGLIKVAECAEKRGISCADYYAIASYEYADAMLAAREAKP